MQWTLDNLDEHNSAQQDHGFHRSHILYDNILDLLYLLMHEAFSDIIHNMNFAAYKVKYSWAVCRVDLWPYKARLTESCNTSNVSLLLRTTE